MVDKEKPFIPENEIVNLIDINSQGTLIHGIRGQNRDKIGVILREGLKPQTKTGDNGASYAPGHVSLSMVGMLGYDRTAAASYGASDFWTSNSYSLVIDTEYVKGHASEFEAAGGYFFESDVLTDSYRDSNGQILHGLAFRPIWGLFGDEVVAKYIPPEAIYGVVSRAGVDMKGLEQELDRMRLERKLVIYTPNGKIHKIISDQQKI